MDDADAISIETKQSQKPMFLAALFSCSAMMARGCVDALRFYFLF